MASKVSGDTRVVLSMLRELISSKRDAVQLPEGGASEEMKKGFLQGRRTGLTDVMLMIDDVLKGAR